MAAGRWQLGLIANIFVFGHASVALAETPLPPTQVLGKLALTLTGESPRPAEMRAFAKDAGGGEAAFLAAYKERLDAYLEDPGFADAVAAYHTQWWHVPPGESTKLASFIVTQDRPYREIFQRDYIYVDGSGADAYRAAGIQTVTPLPDGGDDYEMVRLAPSETRFRSLFSAQDFLNTFPDTATNHNRKRSNQIFRNFLCQELVNTLIPGVAIPDKGPHGTDPDCQGCHTRLDPMARFFDHWRPAEAGTTTTFYDPAPEASGAVVLAGADGKAEAFPGSGESDLGRILLTLPAAQKCIVEKIWEFAYGVTTPLPAEAQASLLETYQRTGRFKATLREALLHPYFWSTATPPPPSFSQVKGNLETCMRCHGSFQAPMFTLNQYPFRSDHAANVLLLQQIYGSASGAPNYPRMPLPPQPPISPESLAKLRAWIAAGAQDDQHKPSLNDAEIKEVLRD